MVNYLMVLLFRSNWGARFEFSTKHKWIEIYVDKDYLVFMVFEVHRSGIAPLLEVIFVKLLNISIESSDIFVLNAEFGEANLYVYFILQI